MIVQPSNPVRKHTPAAGLAPVRLHTRVITVFALLTIAPLVLGALMSLILNVSFSRQEITQDQTHIAASVGTLVSTEWSNTIAKLRVTGSLVGQVSADERPSILAAAKQMCSACQALALVDPAGAVEYGLGEPLPLDELDAHIQTVLHTGTPYLPTNLPGGHPSAQLPVVLPIDMPGQQRRALVALVDVQTLGSQALSLVQSHHDGYGYIVDQQGYLLVSPSAQQALPGRELVSIPLVAAAVQGNEWKPPYSQVYIGLLAPRVDGVWYRIPELGWFVLVEAPFSSSQGIIVPLFAIQGLLVLLTSVIAIIFSQRLATTITWPIEQIQRGVAQLQSGNWAKPIHVQRQDEIGQLAQAFNTMAYKLHSDHLALATRSNELALANRELEQAVGAARTANVLKSQFVATISHELRTPLTAVLGFTDLLWGGVYGELTDEQVEVTVRIQESGRHLLQLINDLLDFSKLEADKLVLNEGIYSPRELIGEVLRTCAPLLEAKNLPLRLEIDPSLPPAITGDTLRVRQILLNLLANAIKFTERGSISVRATLLEGQNETQPSGERQPFIPAHIVLVVEDTGIGIAPENHTAIFEHFRQMDGDYTRQAGGTGLGLAITQRLVMLMRGTITVTSEVGVGSRFTVTLPLASLGEPAGGSSGERME